MKRLHPIALVTLCISIVFSNVPAYAAETAQENTAAEVMAAEQDIAGENVEDEAPQNAEDTDETGTMQGAEIIDETEDVTAAEATNETTEDTAETTEDAVTTDAAAAEETAADATTEIAAADENATAATTEAAATDEAIAGATATEAADEVVATEAGEAEEAAAAAVTAEATVAEEAAAEEAAAEIADSAAQESQHAAAPALQSVAGAVEEKVAQMKLEVIDYLDEGFGDGQMLSSGGSRLLIDTYSQGSWNVLDSWLNDKKYMDFDIYISHYHGDHMGNVENILNDGKYKVNKLYLPDYGYMTGSSSYMSDYRSECESMMRTASSKGVEIVQLVRDSIFTVGDVLAEVLWGAEYEDDSHDTHYINNNSLVTRFTCGNTRYLNAGDIEVATEFEMLEAGVDLSADICKLSHHGGDTSNTYDFLEAVGAEFYYYNYCGDTPSTFSPKDSWTYWSVHDAQELGNVASVRYNGNITYGVYDDVITQELERNYTTQTIYLYDPDDPNKLRGIVTQDFNKAATEYIGDRAYGGYDYSTTWRENSYADDGWIIGNGDTQYYYRDNEPVTGWLEDGGSKYYMNPDTAKKETGWLTLDPDTYFFDETGRMQTGFVKIGTAVHHFDEQGRQTKTGWKKIDGNWYYFGEYNKLALGVHAVGGKKYLFDWRTGILQTGVVWQGSRLYFADGSGVVYPAGWTKYNGSWYYLDGNGRAAIGWQKVSGKWYLMNSSGVMQTGWQLTGGKWYYLDASGAMKTGWQKIDGKWYYMTSSGAMKTGWQRIDGKWYYLDSKGVMQTGWHLLGGKWYYMDVYGVMKTGWQKIDGDWYYMTGGGAMKTGWQRIDGKWYYLNSKGVMQTGWQNLGGKWFYLDGSGAMATGWRTIGGRRYYFNSSGVWVK